MTGDDLSAPNRRQVLRALGASTVSLALAGCSQDSSGTDSPTESETVSPDTSDVDRTESSTSVPGSTTESESTNTSVPGSTTESASPTTETESGAAGSVTVNVSLQVRASQSNVEEFETLRTTFEAVELVSTDGDTVRLDDASQDIDLTELGPGGSVGLFETTMPAGQYGEGKLYLPIQNATLSGGGEPEFDRTVPATREFASGALEIESGSTIDLTVTVALIRIAGDGPWTYTVGFGVSEG